MGSNLEGFCLSIAINGPKNKHFYLLKIQKIRRIRFTLN